MYWCWIVSSSVLLCGLLGRLEALHAIRARLMRGGGLKLDETLSEEESFCDGAKDWSF